MLQLILSIVGGLVPTILANRGVIGSSTENLITSLVDPARTLLAGIRAGNSASQDALAALAAASGVIAVLKSSTGLPADALTQVAGADKDIQAALTAYAKAGLGLDLTQYQPVAEV